MNSQQQSQQNPKRKLTKILQNLQIQLDTCGLSEKIQFKLTNNPWEDLQNIHQNIVSYILTNNRSRNGGGDADGDDEPQSRSVERMELIKSNQLIILDCLKFFINIHVQMSKLSKILYSQNSSDQNNNNCSLQLYKSYRKLYEQISITSNCLYQFESEDAQFLKEKQELITQNLQICEQIGTDFPEYKDNIKNGAKNSRSGSNNNLKDNKNQDRKIQQFQKVIQSLKRQNELLNNLIRQNDQQFTLQIQRYNNTLFDMQQTIRQYQVRMDKVRQYQAVIDDLQHKIIRLKEEKYRDDMLIDNMSKKIRYFEKQRGGVDVFLSPRINQSRKQVMSPARMFNHSMVGPQIMEQKTAKNYYGERLTTN